METPVNKYERDLKMMRGTLARLFAQREEVEMEIARTKRKIALLAELNSAAGAEPADLELGGLSSAVCTALRASRKGWITGNEIMVALRELGFPLGRYKAPLASVTTTVARLATSGGSVAKRISSSGAMEYKWVGPMWGAPGSLANQMADSEHEKMMRYAAEVSREATKRRNRRI